MHTAKSFGMGILLPIRETEKEDVLLAKMVLLSFIRARVVNSSIFGSGLSTIASITISPLH